MTSTTSLAETAESLAGSQVPADLLSMAQRSQQFMEQSIQKFPALSVGVAIAAGVALGCLFKRS